MKNVLKLRNLNYELEPMKVNDRYHIYYNAERNTIILAGFTIEEGIAPVFNGITEDAYNRLINYMNNHNDLIIDWDKVEGTTSDYTIYCDCDYSGKWNKRALNKYLYNLYWNEEESDNYRKYNIVKDGIRKHFKAIEK